MEQIMIKVNGIAGVFLYANDPKTLAEWYTLHFGLEFLPDIADTYYMEFYFRDHRKTLTNHSNPSILEA
jgi:hypothetical protein